MQEVLSALARRSSSTRVIGSATFKGHREKVYDRVGDDMLRPTIFPRKEDIRGPFGKTFSVRLNLYGERPRVTRMHKEARRVKGRTVPVLVGVL